MLLLLALTLRTPRRSCAPSSTYIQKWSRVFTSYPQLPMHRRQCASHSRDPLVAGYEDRADLDHCRPQTVLWLGAFVDWRSTVRQ